MPWLASPAIASPEAAATASGRNSGSVAASAANATNSPLLVIASKKPGPPPPPAVVGAGRHLDRDREQDRDGREHAEEHEVAAPAEDDGQLRAQEPPGQRDPPVHGAARRVTTHVRLSR